MRNSGTNPDDVLIFDRAGIRETDVQAINRYGMTGLELMENAAEASAQIVLRMLETTKGSGPVVIVCGRGNNGGDGYAIARLLHDLNVPVRLLVTGAPRSGSDSETNARRAEQMGIERISDQGQFESANLIVDAMLGTGLDREVTGENRQFIEAINASAAPVLSIDVPSGLDTDTGQPLGMAVRATETVTFAGLKIGFLEPEARDHTGMVHVVDIGIPRVLARSLALNPPNTGAPSNTEL